MTVLLRMLSIKKRRGADVDVDLMLALLLMLLTRASPSWRCCCSSWGHADVEVDGCCFDDVVLKVEVLRARSSTSCIVVAVVAVLLLLLLLLLLHLSVEDNCFGWAGGEHVVHGQVVWK